METIIDQLKNVDKEARRSIRILQLIYVFMISVLLYYMFHAADISIVVGIGFIILAFLLVIFVQQLRFRKYKYTYANSPVPKFLNDAKNRMRVFTQRTWLVLPIWILIDIGLGFIISAVFPYPEYIVPVIILLQVVLVILVVIDFYTAYLIWKKEHKPVVTEIDKMIHEIEGN